MVQFLIGCLIVVNPQSLFLQIQFIGTSANKALLEKVPLQTTHRKEFLLAALWYRPFSDLGYMECSLALVIHTALMVVLWSSTHLNWDASDFWKMYTEVEWMYHSFKSLSKKCLSSFYLFGLCAWFCRGDRILLRTSGCHRTHCIHHAGIQLNEILLSISPKCRDEGPEPLDPPCWLLIVAGNCSYNFSDVYSVLLMSLLLPFSLC